MRFAKIFRLLAASAVVLLAGACGTAKVGVMSFNVRYGTAKDGDFVWENRRDAAVAMILDQRPAVFGVQEALDFQLDYFVENCPGYLCVGVGREDGVHGGEHMSVLYDSERLELKDWGTYWLSETPDVPSLGWDARCKRTATWTLLYDKKYKKHFYFVNTHLDHVGVEARKNGLNLVIDRIAAMNPEDYPMILCGDFNMNDNDKGIQGMRLLMSDAWITADAVDYGTTWHNWGKQPDDKSPIDYIFYRGFKSCRNISRIKTQYLGVQFVSDHYPVSALLEY